MTRKKGSSKEKKAEKDKPKQDSKHENETDECMGVLPNRDLKKNLGCG